MGHKIQNVKTKLGRALRCLKLRGEGFRLNKILLSWNSMTLIEISSRVGKGFLSHITRREDASMERFMVQGKGEDTRPRARPSMRSTTLELHKKSCSTRGMAMDR